MKEFEKQFVMLAKTLRGLEEVLAEELKQLGARKINMQNRAVQFQGDTELLYKANMMLRTAIKVLVPIRTFRAVNEEQLYKQVMKTRWDEYFQVEQSFAIESVMNSKNFKHTKFPALKTKDAIADYFRKVCGKRPNVEKDNPDMLIHLHISRDDCTLLIDSSGDSLHKRGYRLEKNEAPLNEILAAGMILLSGWNKKSNFLDPMCGSGTLPIEAAMIAGNIPPCLNRDFGFMKWDNFDNELFESVKNELEENINDSQNKLFASEISAETAAVAKSNIRRAGLENLIEVKTIAFENRRAPEGGGVIIMNPPYGQRMKKEDLQNFYSTIGDTLKKRYAGYEAWVLSANKDAMKSVGLRPSKKFTLYNGPLECKFYNYSLYEGSKKAKYNKAEKEN